MKRNIDFTVQWRKDAYCLTLSRALEAPKLYYSVKAYDDNPVYLATFSGQQMWIPAPVADRRLYFSIQSKEATPLWAGDTAVEIQAVENFRDQGGYLTESGATVKWGRFFRCGAVRDMEGSERALYDAMGIASIFDYRATDEAAHRPDEPGPGTIHHSVPAIDPAGSGSKFTDMDMARQLQNIHSEEDAEEMYRIFLSLYHVLPFGNSAYAAMFSALDSLDTVPLIQHCSAGKDRTGVGCALLLIALGVDKETVMEDYLLSALFRREANRSYIASLKASGVTGHALALMEKMMTVTRDMLEGSYAAIEKKYSSYEEFFKEEYGITGERLAHWRRLHTI